jgi:hypothetical protein
MISIKKKKSIWPLKLMQTVFYTRQTFPYLIMHVKLKSHSNFNKYVQLILFPVDANTSLIKLIKKSVSFI